MSEDQFPGTGSEKQPESTTETGVSCRRTTLGACPYLVTPKSPEVRKSTLMKTA
jgi:hypothetical protein